MKKAIAVIFDPIVDVKHMAEFEEVIRSNYVSKRGKENGIQETDRFRRVRNN